jgi:hypothetical protein
LVLDLGKVVSRRAFIEETNIKQQIDGAKTHTIKDVFVSITSKYLNEE